MKLLEPPRRGFASARRPCVRILTALFAAVALLGTAPDALAQGKKGKTGLEDLEKKVETFTLSNGLKFIVVERRQAPVFSFLTAVNAGAANDQIGTTGIAHMMEHMAFKGTEIVGVTDPEAEARALEEVEAAWNALHRERAKGSGADTARLAELEARFQQTQEKARSYVVSNEFSQILEQHGAQGLNAFTAMDFTGYAYSMPSNRLELWALMEGSRMAFPVFREFYKERDVVYEERRMRVESSPFGRLVTEFLQTAYVAHPYGIGGIGHPSDLKTFNRTEGAEFYRTYYVAPNMVVAVVGDVKAKEVEKYAEKYFGDLPAGPMPPPLDTEEPQQRAERRVIMEDESQPMLLVGWHIPAATDPSYPAYEALANLLGGGNFSRLYKRLVKEKKMAVQVQAFAGLPGSKFPSMLGLLAVPAAGQDPRDVEKEIYAVLNEVRGDRPFTQEELDGYKVRTRASLISESASNSSLASNLAVNQILFGDWREFFRGVERVQELTLDDLDTAMETSLRRMNRTVAMIVSPASEESSETAAAVEGGSE